jgi:hypothetical protein
MNDGSLSDAPPAAGAEPTTYDYAPADAAGPATLFANNQGQPAGGNATDQRPFEPLRLTWSSEPLKKALEVTGTVTVDLYVSSTTGDPNFAARLVDVAPDGKAIQISRGWVSAAHYPDDAHPKPLAPGEVRRVQVRIWETSNVFAAGHRIRVDVGGSDFPLMEVNPNRHTDTILSDPGHPSAVTLPVIEAKQPPAAAALGLPAPAPGPECEKRSSLKVKLRAPRGQRLRSAIVHLNGKKVRSVRGRALRKAVVLRRLPAGQVVVRIVARTRSGRTVTSTRTYRICAR